MLADGKDLVLIGGWWATFFPGLLILITVLALNLLAEGVSDAWAAPSAKPQAQQAAQQELARAASENQPRCCPTPSWLRSGLGYVKIRETWAANRSC